MGDEMLTLDISSVSFLNLNRFVVFPPLYSLQQARCERRRGHWGAFEVHVAGQDPFDRGANGRPFLAGRFRIRIRGGQSRAFGRGVWPRRLRLGKAGRHALTGTLDTLFTTRPHSL